MNSLSIYKYQLFVVSEQTLRLPKGAQVLSVQEQHGLLQLWALVDPAAPLEPRLFSIVGTGREVIDSPGKLKFLASVQMENGNYVWHVFERVNNEY